MKFPLSEIDKNQYVEKISGLLEDDECQLFIDTNILALLFRIYSSARKEFFDWLLQLQSKKRVSLPLWAANEYSNRIIRNQIDDYFSPLKKISTTQKEFDEISSFLRMNIDYKSLAGSSYDTEASYLKDLDDIAAKLKRIASTAKKKDENYKNSVHAEIQKIFEGSIMESDLNAIMELVSNTGKIRFDHKIPPGFEDGNKEQNSFGDLIIWFEILKFCKAKSIKKAILITNDNKKDWVYAPSKILNNSKLQPNSNHQFKVVDPRLVDEFKSFTGSEEFHVVNFEILTQILINKSKGKFIELAKALQIATLQVEENEHEKKTEESSGELNTEKENKEPHPIVEVTPLVEANAGEENYSEYALADSDFPLYDSTITTETIINLKRYNWYVQNPALEKFLNSVPEELKETQSNKDKLFVIGRNIYQAACGGASLAIETIQDLRKVFQEFSDFVITHLYSGMLYEIYFDSKNRFRDNNFKSTFINEVFEVHDNKRLEKSLVFINNKLLPFESQLVFLPRLKPSTIDICVEYEDNEIPVKNFMGNIEIYNSIKDVRLNGKSAITENQVISLDGSSRLLADKEEICNILSTFYAIPKKQMELTILPKESDQIRFLLEDERWLAKLPLPNEKS